MQKLLGLISLRDLNNELARLRDNARNPDSDYNVAAALFYRTPDGTIKLATAINTEISYGIDTNICAERNALNYARRDGHNIKVLATYIMGGPRDDKFNRERLRHTPCCALCQDQLMQFSTSKTTLHSIPMNHGLPKEKPAGRADSVIYTRKEEEVAIALANVLDMPFNLPGNLYYNSEAAFAIDRNGKPAGIFSNSTDSTRKLQTILDGMIHSLGTIPSKKALTSLPPTDGELTKWLLELGELTPEKHIDLEQVGTILAIMRNERCFHTDGEKVGRIESAIVVTEDKRYFCATTIHGEGISKQDQALSAAIKLAHQSVGGMAKITHAFMMGDPIKKGKNRMFPLVRELYLLAKRSPISESTDPEQQIRYPSMKIFVYPPVVPGKKLTLDSRNIDQRLEIDAKVSEVIGFRLDELTGKVVFFPAKQQRKEGLIITSSARQP